MPKKAIFVAIAVLFAGALAVGFRWYRHHHRQTGPVSMPCVDTLKAVKRAKDRWAAANQTGTNDVPTWDDIQPYFLRNGAPKCPDGGTYTLGRVGELPTCSLGGPYHTVPRP